MMDLLDEVGAEEGGPAQNAAPSTRLLLVPSKHRHPELLDDDYEYIIAPQQPLISHPRAATAFKVRSPAKAAAAKMTMTADAAALSADPKPLFSSSLSHSVSAAPAFSASSSRAAASTIVTRLQKPLTSSQLRK